MTFIMLLAALGLAFSGVVLLIRVEADVQCYGNSLLLMVLGAFWCFVGAGALVYLALA